MPFDLHTVELPDGSTPNYSDRVVQAMQFGIANPSAAEGAATAAVAVSFASPLPPNYVVDIDSGQAGVGGTASAKTSTGFNVTLFPLASTITIAAGTFNVTVSG